MGIIGGAVKLGGPLKAHTAATINSKQIWAVGQWPMPPPAGSTNVCFTPYCLFRNKNAALRRRRREMWNESFQGIIFLYAGGRSRALWEPCLLGYVLLLCVPPSAVFTANPLKGIIPLPRGGSGNGRDAKQQQKTLILFASFLLMNRTFLGSSSSSLHYYFDSEQRRGWMPDDPSSRA